MQLTRCSILTSRPRPWPPSQVIYLLLKRVTSTIEGNFTTGKQHYPRHLKAARWEEDLWMVLGARTLDSTLARVLRDGMVSTVATTLPLPIMGLLRIEMARPGVMIAGNLRGTENVVCHRVPLPQQTITT